MLKNLAITTAIALAIGAPGAASAQDTRIELSFVDHIGAGMIEQDVYVSINGSGGVERVTPQTYQQYLKAPLFATAKTVHHDPMNSRAVGPYELGHALGITLEQWRGAKGSATYTCEAGESTLEASFQELVPGGLYTMWYAFMPTPAARPFSTYDLPLGARDGSQSVFTVDESGSAEVTRSFEGCLQLSGKQLMAMLAVAWHSDNRTWGSNPGPFGHGTHVQLFAPLPAEGSQMASR